MVPDLTDITLENGLLPADQSLALLNIQGVREIPERERESETERERDKVRVTKCERITALWGYIWEQCVRL